MWSTTFLISKSFFSSFPYQSTVQLWFMVVQGFKYKTSEPWAIMLTIPTLNFQFSSSLLSEVGISEYSWFRTQPPQLLDLLYHVNDMKVGHLIQEDSELTPRLSRWLFFRRKLRLKEVKIIIRYQILLLVSLLGYPTDFTAGEMENHAVVFGEDT